MFLASIITIGATICFACLCSYFYHGEVLVYWTRIEFCFTACIIVLLFMVDSFRCVFMAFDLKYIATALESICLCLAIAFGLGFSFGFDFGIWGVEFACIGAMGSMLI